MRNVIGLVVSILEKSIAKNSFKMDNARSQHDLANHTVTFGGRMLSPLSAKATD